MFLTRLLISKLENNYKYKMLKKKPTKKRVPRGRLTRMILKHPGAPPSRILRLMKRAGHPTTAKSITNTRSKLLKSGDIPYTRVPHGLLTKTILQHPDAPPSEILVRMKKAGHPTTTGSIKAARSQLLKSGRSS